MKMLKRPIWEFDQFFIFSCTLKLLNILAFAAFFIPIPSGKGSVHGLLSGIGVWNHIKCPPRDKASATNAATMASLTFGFIDS